MGESVREVADLFEACRSKRNAVHYRRQGQTTVAEVEELIAATRELRGPVLAWVAEHHPRLAPGAS